ncbi:MAG TPA: cytochrome c oxidase assembly protein [Stellaceae bacterium]|nr:cytochrome c oxidase assembly protein [Stellaceae bacterium]
MTRGDRGKRWTVSGLLLVVACMVALVVASVPLYRLFCTVTGYNGTTQRAQSAPVANVPGRVITVRFDANTAPNLDWEFRPLQSAVQVHPGETKTVAYHAVNRGPVPVIGTATFNVTPAKTGLYFDKLQCFCFTRQSLAPGEAKDLTVTFFVDPDIVNDSNDADVDTITLSYTMFRAQDQDGAAQTASVPVAAPAQFR